MIDVRRVLFAAATACLVALTSTAPAAADQCINDDLIVDGSLCVGFDCVCGETFGFDTIRLKENNLRIKFEDTSVVPGFPSNDWQLTANDSASGGANKFSIDDISGSRTPFTVEAGAPSHSLYVDDGGRIGNGTSTPSVEIHVVDGDSPTLRLQQDGSSGFEPQTWDVVGNETNFFVRDVTHGSALTLRLRPGAPSNSIFVDIDGDVGFGTSSPGQELHIRRSDASSTGFVVENTNATAQNVIFDMTNPGGSWRFRAQSTGNFEIIDNDLSLTRLSIGSGGLVSIAGGLSIGGTCSDSDGGGGGADGCDRVFEPDYPLPTIDEHAAEMWEKRHLPAVGPTPDGERISINVFEKTTGMLNELEKAHIYIEQLHRDMQKMAVRLAELEARLGPE